MYLNDFNIAYISYVEKSIKSGIYNSDLRKPKFSLQEIREIHTCILTWMRPCDKL